ncbi:hypothetical protein ACVWDX_28405, partial [Escherichia coli]
MGSCAAPSAKGDDKFITTDYLQQCLTADVRDHLDKLLSEMLAGNISRFIWLRNFEVGNNSAAANRLL